LRTPQERCPYEFWCKYLDKLEFDGIDGINGGAGRCFMLVKA